MEEFPPEWGLQGDSQRFIACWETLAQQALMELRAQTIRGSCQEVAFKQDCDNSPAEGAGNKLFTTKVPLKYFIQSLAGVMASLDLEVVISHRPRILNEWADGLSRGFPAVVQLFNPLRRVRLPPAVLVRTRSGFTIFPTDSKVPNLKL